jgi:hypothetical protein
MIVTALTDEDNDMVMAKDVGDTLFEKYPGHLWAIEVRSGVVIVKCLNISSQWGFILKYKDVKDDAGFRKKEVIRAGGELLERAGLKRGAYELGARVKKFDGVDNYKPRA